MTCFNRGSEWRRWDLHLHTPGTKKNDQYKGKDLEEKWDRFYSSISEYIGDGKDLLKNIAVVGITDYLSIDNYLKVIKDGRLPPSIKLVLPNVELRMTPMAKKSPINIHCIFNPDIVKDLETRFFGKLKFTYGRTYSASYSELCCLGRDFSSNNMLNDEEAYNIGLEQYVINIEILKEVFDNDPELRENTIIAVSNSSSDGVSGIIAHSSYLIKNGSQMDATRIAIYQMADLIFSSNSADRKYFLGKCVDDVETVKRKYHSLKGCIHGSDAHTNNKIFEPDGKKYCWIKADPTFNGFRQILYEPEDRICISPIEPNKKPDYQIIERVEFLNDDFSPNPILFNDKLTCIIGGKSTGKSLLLNNMARVIDLKQEKEKLEVTKGNYKRIDDVKVFWRDGFISSINNSDDNHKIVYIPQTYLNRLSDETEEVTEIDKIIHEIILINEEANKAFKKMENSLKDNKLNIDQYIYRLVQNFNELKEQKEKLSNIGSFLGIEKEIDNLKNQKKSISKQYSLSEEDIQEYDNAISKVSQINVKIEQIKEEIIKVKTIKSVVIPIELNDFYSEKTKNMLECSIKDIIENVNDLWVSNRKKIIDELKRQLLIIEEDKKEQQDVINRLLPKIEKNESIKKLTQNIQDEEKKKMEFEKIDLVIKRKQKEFTDNLNSLIKSFLRYYDIHEEYANFINNNSSLNNDNLEFSVETPYRTEMFIKQIESMFDKRTLKAQKAIIDIDKFSREWIKEENIKKLIEACLNENLRLIRNKTRENALRDIMDDWYNTTYKVTMDGDLIDDMSPGKKALVLLKMLINLAESKCPILIDQPEDDLDNRSIFDELIPFIRRKKNIRQIIIVTHNANVVLGGDAEEVIVANQRGKNTPNEKYRFEYRSGAIEDDKPYNETRKDVLGKQGIQQHICDILEGGKVAFDLRKHKYRI